MKTKEEHLIEKLTGKTPQWQGAKVGSLSMSYAQAVSAGKAVAPQGHERQKALAEMGAALEKGTISFTQGVKDALVDAALIGGRLGSAVREVCAFCEKVSDKHPAEAVSVLADIGTKTTFSEVRFRVAPALDRILAKNPGVAMDTETQARIETLSARTAKDTASHQAEKMAMQNRTTVSTGLPTVSINALARPAYKSKWGL